MKSDNLLDELNLGVAPKLIHASEHKQVYLVKNEKKYDYYLKVYSTEEYDIYALERLFKLLYDNGVTDSRIEIMFCNNKYGIIKEEKCKGSSLADINYGDARKIMYTVGTKIAMLNSIRYAKAKDIIPIWDLKHVCAKDIYANIFRQTNLSYLRDEEDKLFYTKCKQMIKEELQKKVDCFAHNDINLWHIFVCDSKCTGLIDFDMLSRGGTYLNISQALFSIIGTKLEPYGSDLVDGYNDYFTNYVKCNYAIIVSYVWLYLVWKISISAEQNKEDACNYYIMKLKRLKQLLNNLSFTNFDNLC